MIREVKSMALTVGNVCQCIDELANVSRNYVILIMFH